MVPLLERDDRFLFPPPEALGDLDLERDRRSFAGEPRGLPFRLLDLFLSNLFCCSVGCSGNKSVTKNRLKLKHKLYTDFCESF